MHRIASMLVRLREMINIYVVACCTFVMIVVTVLLAYVCTHLR